MASGDKARAEWRHASSLFRAPEDGRSVLFSCRFDQRPYRAREWSRSRKLVARVEATSLGADTRFVVINLEGRGKVLCEKGVLARDNAENLIKAALPALGQDRVRALAGQPVCGVPHRSDRAGAERRSKPSGARS